jgi:hypothetical protein
VAGACTALLLSTATGSGWVRLAAPTALEFSGMCPNEGAVSAGTLAVAPGSPRSVVAPLTLTGVQFVPPMLMFPASCHTRTWLGANFWVAWGRDHQSGGAGANDILNKSAHALHLSGDIADSTVCMQC